MENVHYEDQLSTGPAAAVPAADEERVPDEPGDLSVGSEPDPTPGPDDPAQSGVVEPVPEAQPPMVDSSAEAEALAAMTEAVDRLVADSQRYHARAEQREGVIERMHDELQLLRRGERRSMLRPLLTEVCRLRDDILRQAETLPEDFDAVRARQLLVSYADSLEIALADNGVVAYRPEPGEPFEPRTHRPVRREPSEALEQVGLIASVRREGYRDLESGLPLSPAEVTVYVAAVTEKSGESSR